MRNRRERTEERENEAVLGKPKEVVHTVMDQI